MEGLVSGSLASSPWWRRLHIDSPHFRDICGAAFTLNSLPDIVIRRNNNLPPVFHVPPFFSLMRIKQGRLHLSFINNLCYTIYYCTHTEFNNTFLHTNFLSLFPMVGTQRNEISSLKANLANTRWCNQSFVSARRTLETVSHPLWNSVQYSVKCQYNINIDISIYQYQYQVSI